MGNGRTGNGRLGAKLAEMPSPALVDAIERSAAPPAVEVALARLVEAHPELAGRLEGDETLRAAVVALAGASRSLTQRLLTDRDAVEVLAELDERPPVDAGSPEWLAGWKSREMLRIAARDLLGIDALEQVGAALASQAEDVLRSACALVGEEAFGLAVIGMGKLGGRELNYASDVDVVFAGEGNARRVMEIAAGCFRVDANLRPEGRQGPLTRSLESYEAYWDRWAEPWEFQALLKARPVAGDPELGGAFAEAAARRVWTRPFGADELRAVRAMKARVEGEVARKGLTDRELKRGRGGIRDIEFAVQLLQLVHGRHDPALRSPTTLEALAELAAAGYVGAADAAALDAAYRFLRTVEHRLQLVDEQQVHALPVDPVARTRLARVLGYRDDEAVTALAGFEDDLRRHQAIVRAIHERLYFRPLLEAFSDGGGAMTPAAAEARLAAFGFTDADRTRQALRELTRGLTRSSRLMQQLLPLLLEWLSESPDPDLGLLGLRTLAAGPHRASLLVSAFRESSEAARRLCLLVGTSRLLQRSLEQHPELIRCLADDEAMRLRRREDLLERAAASLAWRSDHEQGAALLRMKQLEELRIAARDVLALDDVEATAGALTALAEAVLESALAVVLPPVPMAVIAMGRFGGAELSYASDLDVLFVYEGDAGEHDAAAENAAESVLRLVKSTTPATRIYALDADLRPEGKQGRLARSLEAYATYYARWAQTWERQALVRARPVAGDSELGRRFMALVEPFVWAPLRESEVREIRRMKARIERERIPAGDDPQFHLKLGRGSLSDVEWTAQLLQLRHGVRATGTMAALQRLEAAGVLSSHDGAVLADAYRFCERTRNRWFLVKGAPGDALPAQAEQLGRLARSLGTTASRLREDYRRVTRRARAAMERLFYGQGE
jgi:glutamate-ammonia-ligase adenylyltransferase